MEEMGAFSQKVISSKYGEEEGGRQILEVGGAYGVSVWKADRMDWEIVGNGIAFVSG